MNHGQDRLPLVVGDGLAGEPGFVQRHARLSTQNNFDLIRLFAAVQVMVGHALWLVGHVEGLPGQLLNFLPGVPVFFFTSGFLISGAYERNPDTRNYARNRILRICPGLWGSVVLSVVLILILYPEARFWPLIGWALMQGTILQDWNPAFLRGYGIGVANGSLWTIPVELCFYAMTPLIYRIRGNSIDKVLVVVVFASFLLLHGLMAFLDDGALRKAALLTPFPWLGMFACGVLAQRHRHVLSPYVEGRFHWWVLLFACVAVAAIYIHVPLLFRTQGNAAGLLNFIAISGLVLSAAFSFPTLASKTLRRNDVSYGVYILHMPIFNALVQIGVRSYLLAIALTLMAATLSWLAIEKPALRAKRKPTHAV